MTIISPNKMLQGLWIFNFSLGIFGSTWFLFFLFQSKMPLKLLIPIMLIMIFIVLLFAFCIFKVASFSIVSSRINFTIGKSLTYSWNEISKLEPTGNNGIYGGIDVYFKRNIYSELSIWKKPLGTKKAYVRHYNTGLLYSESPSELIEKIIQSRGAC